MRMSAQGPGIEKVQLIDAAGAPLGVIGNPLVSSGGGGGKTVTQGPAGSALQSWYMRDGSGLLATSAQQIDGTQLTKIWGESGVAATMRRGTVGSGVGGRLRSAALNIMPPRFHVAAMSCR